MASYTTNYGLHQWESTDDFLRTDFNTDFQKIDAAIHGLVVFGTFAGDGTDGRVISLGFTPRVVYICSEEGRAGFSSGSGYCYGGLLGPGAPLRLGGTIAAEVVTGGFKLSNTDSYIRLNSSSYVFFYLAVK